jgi:alkylation response protein AidB-like acyl-CoA dehydrogenase
MSAQGYLLFDISVADVVSASVEGSWPTIGMARSLSETLEFDGTLRDDDVVGSADFYLARPGFWFGGAGVAACWFGGAVGLLNGIVPWISAEPRESVLVDLGGAVAAIETMSCVLTTAARAIDDDPTDQSGRARFRTLVVRRVVHDAATTVLEKMASAGGARALCHDEGQSRRAADLYVYLSQHHGNADSQEMGRIFLAAGSWNPSEVTSRT